MAGRKDLREFVLEVNKSKQKRIRQNSACIEYLLLVRHVFKSLGTTLFNDCLIAKIGLKFIILRVSQIINQFKGSIFEGKFGLILISFLCASTRKDKI